MQSYCLSCGMPLAESASKDQMKYCQYCADADGTLKSKQEVQSGIAQWLQSWAPDQQADFMSRAASYMKAMPAWTNI